MAEKKYKLLREKYRPTRVVDGTSISTVSKLRRIQALRDIPRHGVQAGDIGGYVKSGKTLGQAGDCWVGKEAIVDEHSIIRGNALITDQAFVTCVDVGEDTVISDDAFVRQSTLSGNIVVKDNAVIKESGIHGTATIDKNAKIISSSINASAKEGLDAFITDYASIDCAKVDGKFRASGNALITEATVTGDTEISGASQILSKAKISGTSRISGDSVVPPVFEMANVVLHNQVAEYGIAYKRNIATDARKSENIDTRTTEAESYIESIMDLEAEYNSYVTDIVKLIKYPAMADLSIPETQALTIALRAANRAIKSPHVDRLKQAQENLEMAFVVAENRAHILVQSHLDDKKKTSLQKADQLFAIASNDVSSDTEKKASFKKGIQSLEGVIPVSEEAISVFKAKAGLLEIEA